MNITQTGSTFHLLPIILSLTTVYQVWITERTYYSISSHHFVCKTYIMCELQRGSILPFLHIMLSVTANISWIYFSLSQVHMFCTQNREDLLFTFLQSFYAHVTQWIYCLLSLYHFLSDRYTLGTYYTEDVLFTFSQSFYAHVKQRIYCLLSLYHFLSDRYTLGTYYTEDLLFTFSQPLGDQVWGGHREEGRVVGFSGHSFGQVRLPCTWGLYKTHTDYHYTQPTVIYLWRVNTY